MISLREIRCRAVIQKQEGETGEVCNLEMAGQTLKEVIPSKGGAKTETGLVSDFIQLSDPYCDYIEHPVVLPAVLPLPKKAFLLFWPQSLTIECPSLIVYLVSFLPGFMTQ